MSRREGADGPISTGSAAESATSSGIERIASTFATARDQGRAALMPYMMGGFPDLETSAAVIDAYADTGADLIELGAPYSDPLADGPVIHAAGTAALEGGTRFDDVLALCERVSARIPVLPMIYANVAITLGADRFAARLADAGAAGAIIPDLPRDEDPAIAEALLDLGLAPIGFVTPTTPPDRLARIAADAVGFTYVVSLTGVTGERAALPAELTDLVGAVKAASKAPAAVGFGIGTPQHVAEVGRIADGVIVGTRLVREVADAPDRNAAVDGVAAFLAEARLALQGGSGDRTQSQ